jgi:chromosome segregation ATPase
MVLRVTGDRSSLRQGWEVGGCGKMRNEYNARLMTPEELQQLIASNSRTIAALADRLTETVAAIDRLVIAQEAATAERQSNAKAIAALSNQQSEIAAAINRLVDIQEAATAERQELRQATLGIANLLSALDEDRPTVLLKLNRIENKVDRLLQHNDESL